MARDAVHAAIVAELVRSFGNDLVIREWSVRRGATDAFRDALSYAPRLDIAVGPFNTSFENWGRDSAVIRDARHPIIDGLKRAVCEQNHGGIYTNRNPRCVIAIEIENRTSSKHILGGITNASMLGLLGVVIGSDLRIDKVCRIHAYACKRKEVEKAHDDLFGNVACFGVEEFLSLLAVSCRPARRQATHRNGRS